MLTHATLRSFPHQLRLFQPSLFAPGSEKHAQLGS